MSKVTIEIDDEEMRTGFVTVVKETESGLQRGKTPLSDILDLFKEIMDKDTASRQVRLISRFSDSPYLAIGMNGTKWVAIREIPPDDYFLTVAAGGAWKVRLPTLIAKVSNHDSCYLFWTEDETLSPSSIIYPLVIGNIDVNGWICLGTTGLKCTTMDSIDTFVRKVIEAPTTGTYLSGDTKVEDWYQSLTERWDTSVGRKHGITLEKLITRQGRN